jgi:TonB family protein
MALVSRRLLFWLAVPALLSSLIFSFAQTSPDSATSRRLVERSAPVTPELARRMRIAGVVKIEAVVSPDGSVKSVEVKGGHPVLAQAAVNAVLKWKWEPAPHESRQMVEVKFERAQ